jgi:hypothetical protein
MSPKKDQEDTKQMRGTENLFFGLGGSPSPGSLVSFSFSSSLSSPASWDLDREEAWYPYRPSFPPFWPRTTAIGHKTLHRPPPAKKKGPNHPVSSSHSPKSELKTATPLSSSSRAWSLPVTAVVESSSS